jgi:uncharacterized protein YuzE
MKIKYDSETDALYVRLTDHQIIDSEAVRPGIILDFDEKGKVAGIEVLDASQRETLPEPLKVAA